MSSKSLILAGSLSLASMGAQAATVTPTSYDTVNGNTGTYTYWDDTYNGTGSTTTSGSALSGGTGDLTDGVIATGNWFAPGETGKYVGWLNTDPTITFNFAQAYDFTAVTFHFDDSNGSGGVSQPSLVNVNGSGFTIPTNPGSAPFSFTVDLTGTKTDTLTTQLFRSNSWVFLSEVTFEADAVSAVPLPAAGGMLLVGLVGFGALRGRQAKG
ncbi:MAG: VPLPA-CTERM sorting domain-containing protein [Pseudomonadota bacterium]